MSSPDRTRRGLVLALLAAGLAGGCQVRPLYATAGASAAEPTTVEALKRIAVEVQTDRVGQVLMNELIFAFRGGAELVDPAYVLSLIVSEQKTELAITESESVPAANLIAMTVTFTLTEKRTGRVVVSGTSYDTGSYDFSSQRFANLRAERDAEDRAAKAIAQDIRLRVATALAGRR